MPYTPIFRNRPPLIVREFSTEPRPPEDPNAVPHVPRRRNALGKVSRRPHSDATVAGVRRLVEQTALNYDAISARTGVGRASISRWARDMGWMRPFDAPRSTDRLPTWRASQRKKLRTLAERLRLLAERHLAELEAAPAVDAGRLAAALEIVKLARLHAQGRRRHAIRKATPKGGQRLPQIDRRNIDERSRIDDALAALRRAGIDLGNVPKDVLDMVIDANLPALSDVMRGLNKKR